MTQYNIPFDMKFEDKLLGGKLTLKQGVCYVPAVILAGLLVTHSNMISTKVDGLLQIKFGALMAYLVIELILFVLGTIFAFIRVNGYSLTGFLYKKIMFSFKRRVIKFYE